MQTSFRWRFNSNFQVQGNYTWSQLIGNTSGGSTSGIIAPNGALTNYPEFNTFDNRSPRGYLGGDQRHIANIFGVYSLDTKVGTFDFSVSERIASGSPYALAWTLDLDDFAAEYGFPDPDSLGYQNAPSTTTYVLDREAGRGDTVFETNIGVNWSLKLWKVQMYIEIDVFNVFNADSADQGRTFNTTVDEIAPFNVFTETPIEGVHYELDSGFGTPDSAPDYQRPRQFFIDFGFRF